MPSPEQSGYNPEQGQPQSPEAAEAAALAEEWERFKEIQARITATTDESELDELAEWLNNNLQDAIANQSDELAEAIRQELAALDKILQSQEVEPAKIRPDQAERLRKDLFNPRLTRLGIKRSNFSNWVSIPHTEAKAIWGYLGELTIEVSYRLSQLDQTDIAVAHGKRSFQKGGQLLIEVSVTDDGQLNCSYAELSQLSEHPQAIQALRTLLAPLGLDSQLDDMLGSNQ